MKVLIYGDSLVSGLKLVQHSVTLESYPGYMVSELVAIEEQGIGLSFILQEDTYDAVILIAGTNDWAKGQTVEEIITDLRKLQNCCDTIKIVIIMSIANFPGNNALAKLEDDTGSPKILYCDFFEYLDKSMLKSDGRHLNIEGQNLLSEYLEDVLMDIR